MSPSHSTKRLKSLPWKTVADALATFGFAEFEDRVTHLKMWGLDADGKDVILRISKWGSGVPIASQKAHLRAAKISADDWLEAVARIEAIPRP